MPRKNEFNISIAVLHISGLLIYLKLKIKKTNFLKIIKKTYDSTMLFGYIFINRIQPFEALNISSAQKESCLDVRSFKGLNTIYEDISK